MSQDPSDRPTHPMEIPSADGRSRRDFLKAAVIGSGAVAATGGVAAAGLALTGKRPHIIPFIGGVNASGGGDCHACVTSSAPSQSDASDFNVKANGKGTDSPGDFYLWFWDSSLPEGDYTLAVTIQEQGGSAIALGDSGCAFHVKATNQIKLYSPAPFTQCATSIPAAGTESAGATTLSDNPPFPYHHPGGSFLASIHLDWTDHTIGSSGDTKTFTFTVTLLTAGQPFCSDTYQITGHQE